MSAEPVAPDVTEQLSPGLRDWMTLERFHLHKPNIFQNTKRDPSFDIRYLPQHSRPFRLPCYWVPRRRLHVLGAPSSDAMTFVSGPSSDERVLFPIHPSALEDFRPWLREVGARDATAEGLWIWALPTSSIRTLLAWPEGSGDRAVFVKTSVHSAMFRDRRITRIGVGRAVGLNTLVAQMRERLPSELHVLSEVFGFSPRHRLDSGAMLRLVPPEVSDGRTRLAPLFSLTGGDNGRVPLLLAMLERTDATPVEFVDRLLCAWFAPLWAELTLRHGVILESHGQDLMLALSADGVPTGDLYYRDLEGLQIDWELRRHHGWPTPELPNGWAWRETYGTWGHIYHDFLWWKWRTSLFAYLRLVLTEVEETLRQWHERGLVRGPKCAEGELTTLFSHHLFTAVERLFNVSLGPRYDTLRSLNRFVIALVKLRSLTMHGGRGAAAR
ncbi:MAG TPA: IucA/IucC family C-terminal-domain containing protein [Steroidobacter sp.]|uniref:IucA/IucC family C-terminal-domain containing protein n=1 Tax=Steroidobacter sp. TaxID=1978227 RepID=UPI002EDA499E